MEWNVKGNFGASVWIPFDDVNDKSGTMSIIPGWHDKGALPQIPREGGGRDDLVDRPNRWANRFRMVIFH